MGRFTYVPLGSWHFSGYNVGVSRNSGTPNWMVIMENPIKNWWFGGTTIVGNIQCQFSRDCTVALDDGTSQTFPWNPTTGMNFSPWYPWIAPNHYPEADSMGCKNCFYKNRCETKMGVSWGNMIKQFPKYCFKISCKSRKKNTNSVPKKIAPKHLAGSICIPKRKIHLPTPNVSGCKLFLSGAG